MGLTHLNKFGLGLNRAMEAEDTDVLLTGALLRLDQTRGTVDTHNKAACNLRVGILVF